MNILCDYCGSKIDTTKHSSCPYCGATYNDNQEYKNNARRQEELEELKLKDLKENQELNHQKKKLELESAKVDLKHKKQKSPLLKGCLITLIVIAVVFIGFFALCVYIVNVAADMKEKNPDTQQTEIQTTPEPAVVEFERSALYPIKQRLVPVPQITSASEPPVQLPCRRKGKLYRPTPAIITVVVQPYFHYPTDVRHRKPMPYRVKPLGLVFLNFFIV